MDINKISTAGTKDLLILNHSTSEEKQTFSKANLASHLGGAKTSGKSAEQEMKEYQIQQFIKFMNEPGRTSCNPYNDPELLQRTLAGVRIMEQNDFNHLNGVQWVNGLAKGRESIGNMYSVVQKFECLFYCMGYLNQFPIIFDRNYCFIDGFQRYAAAANTPTMFIPYIRYDIDLMTDYEREQKNKRDDRWY